MTSGSMSPATLLIPAAQLINVVLTFWGALLLALLAARVAPSAAICKYALLTPLVKVALYLSAGVPGDSYVRSAFAGTRWELGSFQLGVTFLSERLWPAIVFRLGALQDGRWYGLSGGDVVAHAAFYRGAWLVLLLFVCGLVVVAVARLSARLRGWRAFARALPPAVSSSGVTRRPPWRRRIRLRRDGPARLGAFTTGVLRPCIWLPPRSAGFSRAELAAMLRHELAHVRARDVLLLGMVDLCRDLCWFVPGAGLLAKRVREAAEVHADAAAVRLGAEPAALASAMLRVAEHRAVSTAPSLQIGLGSATLRRARALLQPSPRASRSVRLGRLVLSCGLLLAVLQSSFFGYL